MTRLRRHRSRIAVTLLLVWLRKARPWQWMAVGGVGALALVAMAARVLAG